MEWLAANLLLVRVFPSNTEHCALGGRAGGFVLLIPAHMPQTFSKGSAFKSGSQRVQTLGLDSKNEK